MHYVTVEFGLLFYFKLTYH